MKYKINLSNVPNQELTTALGGHDIGISLHTAYDLMFISISIDNVNICSGVKCIPNTSILPRFAESIIGGRLFFESLSGEYPNFTTINTTDCNLVFEEF